LSNPCGIPPVSEADERFAVQVGQFSLRLDELEKRRPNQFRDHSAFGDFGFFANLTDQWCDDGLLIEISPMS